MNRMPKSKVRQKARPGPKLKPAKRKPAKKAKPHQKVGRKPMYAHIADLRPLIDGYFEECKKRVAQVTLDDGRCIEVVRPQVPTKQGLRLAVNMSEQLWHKYQSGKMGEEFVGPLTRAEDQIVDAVITYGFDGKNHRFAQWYLGAACGMSDVAKHEISGQGGGPMQHTVKVIYGDKPPL